MKFILLHADGYSGLDMVKFPIEVNLEDYDDYWDYQLVYIPGRFLIEAGAKTEQQDPVNGYDPDFDYAFSFGYENSSVVRGE